MESILAALYHGQLQPDETIVPSHPVFGFSHTFGPPTSALPIVFGFSHTFGPHTSRLPIVFGFSHTFGPTASRLPNVFGFSHTFSPHTSRLPNVFGFSHTYLSKLVSAILDSNQEVEGLPEELYSCPCCEFKTLPTKGEYDICPVCFWEDDGSRDPSHYSSPNHMTLAQARDNFIKFGAVDESSLQFLLLDRLELFSK